VRRRLLNLLEQSGASVMTERYRRMTTLYAFAVVLAIERKFAREGVYFELDDYWAGLGHFLRNKRFDVTLRGLHIHHYRRLALADVATIRDGDSDRIRSLLEFLAAYEELRPDTREEFVEPFLVRIEKGDPSHLQSIAHHCGEVVDRIARVTGVQAPPVDARDDSNPRARRDSVG